MHECIQSSRQENKGKNEQKTDRVVRLMRHSVSLRKSLVSAFKR